MFVAWRDRDVFAIEITDNRAEPSAITVGSVSIGRAPLNRTAVPSRNITPGIWARRERLLNEPTGQWKALAVSTFQTYVLLLIVSLFAFATYSHFRSGDNAMPLA